MKRLISLEHRFSFHSCYFLDTSVLLVPGVRLRGYQATNADSLLDDDQGVRPVRGIDSQYWRIRAPRLQLQVSTLKSVQGCLPFQAELQASSTARRLWLLSVISGHRYIRYAQRKIYTACHLFGPR